MCEESYKFESDNTIEITQDNRNGLVSVTINNVTRFAPGHMSYKQLLLYNGLKIIGVGKLRYHSQFADGGNSIGETPFIAEKGNGWKKYWLADLPPELEKS